MGHDPDPAEMPVTHDDAFLQAIIESPDNDGPRLVLADWLEDHGQQERAEFIRVRVALAGSRLTGQAATGSAGRESNQERHCQERPGTGLARQPSRQ